MKHVYYFCHCYLFIFHAFIGHLFILLMLWKLRILLRWLSVFYSAPLSPYAHMALSYQLHFEWSKYSTIPLCTLLVWTCLSACLLDDFMRVRDVDLPKKAREREIEIWSNGFLFHFMKWAINIRRYIAIMWLPTTQTHTQKEREKETLAHFNRLSIFT